MACFLTLFLCLFCSVVVLTCAFTLNHSIVIKCEALRSDRAGFKLHLCSVLGKLLYLSNFHFIICNIVLIIVLTSESCCEYLIGPMRVVVLSTYKNLVNYYPSKAASDLFFFQSCKPLLKYNVSL